MNDGKGLGLERTKSTYKTINQIDKVHFGINKLYSGCIEYGHLIRGKIISAETQKEELTEFIGKVQAILQLLEDAYQHEKEEWEFNRQLEGTEKNEDYEIIDSEIVKLELEKEEWQNLLVKLEDKLTNLENQERQVQAQIISNSWF